jgi:hypothetical protein
MGTRQRRMHDGERELRAGDKKDAHLSSPMSRQQAKLSLSLSLRSPKDNRIRAIEL